MARLKVLSADAFELDAFVRGATSRIRAALRKRGPRGSELEDCVQEVLIEVVERWPKLRGSPPAGRYAYLNAICRGTAVRWLRRTQSTNNRFAEIDPKHEPDPKQPVSPEWQYSVSRLRSALQLCLDGSDAAARMSFLLVYLAGHTEAEAASIQGVPLGTVASRLRRMRARLCDELGGT